MKKFGWAALCGWWLAGVAGLAAAGEAMPVIELSAGMHRIEAEVAAEDRHRQTGLMLREAMPAQRGMLFVFPQENTHCMWMRNTLIPLSVAFIDREGYIINIEEMAPKTEDNHCAKLPARYALEMNQGWFAKRGIARGARLRGLERAPTPR
ncbi:DUF192 domain-containing protein [Azonexus caeni]|jgi:uncharacterized membrane protein (UPF0127 family)|uniref:DUF192 domain-containing protein n=1 Tax=Azonexus caeni TaxID=266126 RepID=UPI003A87902D